MKRLQIKAIEYAADSRPHNDDDELGEIDTQLVEAYEAGYKAARKEAAALFRSSHYNPRYEGRLLLEAIVIISYDVDCLGDEEEAKST